MAGQPGENAETDSSPALSWSPSVWNGSEGVSPGASSGAMEPYTVVQETCHLGCTLNTPGLAGASVKPHKLLLFELRHKSFPY